MPDFAVNRRVAFDYEILDTYEAGIALVGFEVKSVRAGRANLAGAFIVIRGGEAFLVNAAIPPYQAANTPAAYDPMRPCHLLLHRRELKELIGRSSQKGLTMVPLRLYAKGSRIKLSFGIARRVKTFDRRAKISERENRRTIDRALKRPPA